jgi:hypothetical protein
MHFWTFKGFGRQLHKPFEGFCVLEKKECERANDEDRREKGFEFWPFLDG